MNSVRLPWYRRLAVIIGVVLAASQAGAQAPKTRGPGAQVGRPILLPCTRVGNRMIC